MCEASNIKPVFLCCCLFVCVYKRYVQGSCPDYSVGFVPQALKAALQTVCRQDLEAAAALKGGAAAAARAGAAEAANAVGAAGAAVAADAGPSGRASAAGAKILPSRRPPLEPAQLPPPPGIYNLLVQHSAALVAPPLRPLMLDPSSSVGWLYAHGCRCATCGALYAEMRPLAQAVSKLGALGKPALAEGTPAAAAMADAQAAVAAATKRQSQHEAAAHGGAHVHFNQVYHIRESSQGRGKKKI